MPSKDVNHPVYPNLVTERTAGFRGASRGICSPHAMGFLTRCACLGSFQSLDWLISTCPCDSLHWLDWNPSKLAWLLWRLSEPAMCPFEKQTQACQWQKQKEISTFPTSAGTMWQRNSWKASFVSFSTYVMEGSVWTWLSLIYVRNQTKHGTYLTLLSFCVQDSTYRECKSDREFGCKKQFHLSKERTCIIKMQIYTLFVPALLY